MNMFLNSETRAKKLVRENLLKDIRVEFLIHPSPASPAANAGWSDLALKTLTDLGIVELLREGEQHVQSDQVEPNTNQPNPQVSLLVQNGAISYGQNSDAVTSGLSGTIEGPDQYQSFVGQSETDLNGSDASQCSVPSFDGLIPT